MTTQQEQHTVTLVAQAWLSKSADPVDGVDLVTLRLHYDAHRPLEVTATVTPAPDEVFDAQPWTFARDLLRQIVTEGERDTDRVVGEAAVKVGWMSRKDGAKSLAECFCFEFPTIDGTPRFVGLPPDKVVGFVIAIYLLVSSEAEGDLLDWSWLDDMETDR